MVEIFSLIFELGIVLIGALSVLLGVISSLLAFTRKYAAQINPLVRLAKVCACLFLISPVFLCLFSDSLLLYRHISDAGTLYSLFSVAWLFLFVIGSIAYLVNLPGRKDGKEKEKPKTLYLSSLVFLIVSVFLGWLFSYL